MIVSFFRLLGGFSRSREGVVAVEGAILIPVFAIFMFAIYDFVSVYKQIQRAHEAYYAIGDMITAAPDGTITCDMLDRISEVAWALGYNDVANFSRAFKRWSGKTPREYREGI